MTKLTAAAKRKIAARNADFQALTDRLGYAKALDAAHMTCISYTNSAQAWKLGHTLP